jgi:hypothetical protein
MVKKEIIDIIVERQRQDVEDIVSVSFSDKENEWVVNYESYNTSCVESEFMHNSITRNLLARLNKEYPNG